MGLNKYEPEVEDVFDKILYRPEENINDYNMLESLLEKYINHHIQKYFGLTITEFMSLTKPETEALIKVAEKKEAESAKIMSDIQQGKNVNPSKGFNGDFDLGGFK